MYSKQQKNTIDKVANLIKAPATTFNTGQAINSMIVLFTVVFLIAPSSLLVSNSNPIVTVAVVIAASGMMYALYLLYTGHLFEGLIAAFLFFAPINLRLPVVPAPERAHIYLLLFDLTTIPLLGLLLYWQRDSSSIDKRLNKLMLTIILLMVAWAWLTVPFSTGPSQRAMVAWAVEQTRYGLVFITAFLAVRYVGLASAMLLSIVSVSCHIVFSIFQIINGESPERLYFLGSQIGGRITTVDVFGWSFEAGLYAGGLVGSSRDLGVLVLLMSPAAIYFASVENRATVPYISFLGLGAVQLAFTYSVSMFGSFLVLSSLLVVVVFGRVRPRYSRATIRRAYGSLLAMPLVLGIIYVRPVFSLVKGIGDTVTTVASPSVDETNDTASTTKSARRESTDDGTTATPSDTTTPSDTPTSTDVPTPTDTPSTNESTSTPANDTPTPSDTPTSTDVPTPTDTPSTNESTSTPANDTPVTRELKDSEKVVVEVVERVPLVSSDTLPVRITQYDAAVRMALDSPIFGVGGYNFKILSKSYDGFRQLDAVHNTFLAYLAGNGVPGLVLYLASVLLVLGSAVHKSFQSSSRATLTLFLGTGMIAFHAASFWTLLYTTPGPYVVFWLIAGLVVGSE